MNLKTFLALFTLATLANGYKVLVMCPFNGKSHFLYMQSFVKTLLNRGHEVAFLTSQSMGKDKPANYTEILIDPPIDIHAMFPQEMLLALLEASIFSTISDMPAFINVMNIHAFENPNVQKLIHSTDLHFDIVINEEFFGDSFTMFAHKFRAPLVTICPFGIANHIDLQQGLLTPWSIAPHWMLPYSDNMSFYERWFNSVVCLYDWYVRKFVSLPAEERLAQKYFAHLAPLPSLSELANNISIMFVNNHRALSPPRPAMPGTIDIGGAHIQPAKALPKDLQTFLDESKHGVIYFSLGTVLKSSLLPKEKIQIFLDAFRSLKQNVLWKFEDDSLTDIPPNVKILKWAPQNDILAHPNVILFISHGGLFGTSESLYHGVPLLLIPFFAEQQRNAHRVVRAGYGKFIIFSTLNKEILAKRIDELVSDDSYLENAKQASAVFKDNIVHPMDEVMFWVEHVAKFKGAKHLKSHAVNMSWFTYLLLDVFIVNLLTILAVVFALYYLIVRKLLGKKKIDKNIAKKRN